MPVVAPLSHGVPTRVTAPPPEPYWFEGYDRAGSGSSPDEMEISGGDDGRNESAAQNSPEGHPSRGLPSAGVLRGYRPGSQHLGNRLQLSREAVLSSVRVRGLPATRAG
jgi:hypothetical protein